MSFIIGKKCVSTCDTACVDVCPVDCIHGPIDITGGGVEVKTLDSIEGLQLFINPDECIEAEGDDESVRKNYEFFGEEWDG